MLNIKLVELRKESKMTQEQVAEYIDVSRQTISNWENGSSVPSIAKTQMLLSLYGKTLNDIETGNSLDISILENWIGVLSSIQTTSGHYERAEIIEIDGTWATLKVIKRKSEAYIIYNIENIIGLRRIT